jgi:hypothetical protein
MKKACLGILSLFIIIFLMSFTKSVVSYLSDDIVITDDIGSTNKKRGLFKSSTTTFPITVNFVKGSTKVEITVKRTVGGVTQVIIPTVTVNNVNNTGKTTLNLSNLQMGIEYDLILKAIGGIEPGEIDYGLKRVPIVQTPSSNQNNQNRPRH